MYIYIHIIYIHIIYIYCIYIYLLIYIHIYIIQDERKLDRENQNMALRVTYLLICFSRGISEWGDHFYLKKLGGGYSVL